MYSLSTTLSNSDNTSNITGYFFPLSLPFTATIPFQYNHTNIHSCKHTYLLTYLQTYLHTYTYKYMYLRKIIHSYLLTNVETCPEKLGSCFQLSKISMVRSTMFLSTLPFFTMLVNISNAICAPFVAVTSDTS